VAVPIKKTLERIPGAMMIVPLLVGAVIHTVFPKTGTYFGSFTGALFSGSLTILAVFYVCMGASIDLKTTPYILKKGGTLFGRHRPAAARAVAGRGRFWRQDRVRPRRATGRIHAVRGG